jgi:exodeoxyribonuclease V gamma subunit
MTLVAYSSSDLDGLIKPLIVRLASSTDDPFAKEIVVVPSSGVRDYLIESVLSTDRHGSPISIVANFDFMYPGKFISLMSGFAEDSSSAWNVDSLRWEILSLLRESPALAPRFSHTSRQLRYATRLAELFDNYGAHRPEMLYDWHKDDLEGTEPVLVDASFAWQFKLWVELRRRLGPSPAELIVEGLRNVVTKPSFCRITLVGLHALSPSLITAVEALSTQTDVGMFVISPSSWSSGIRISEPPIRRREITMGEPLNDLAARWGRVSNESQLLLSHVIETTRLEGRRYPETLLGCLQRDINADVQPDRVRAKSSETDRPIARTDGSIQFHLCHGEVRQVEVLRDAILHRMKSDPTLSLRDFLVLSPEPEHFASIIEPVFGALSIRVVVNTSSTGDKSELGRFVDGLQSVLGGRCTARQLLDFIALDTVASKFGLTSEDLIIAEEIVTRLDIRWGLDGNDRLRAGFDDSYHVGTWRHAVDRVIASVFVNLDNEQVFVKDLVPFPLRGIQDGLVISKIDAILSILTSLADPLSATTNQPIKYWADVVATILDELIDVDRVDGRDVASLRGLGQKLQAISVIAPGLTLELLDVTEALMQAAASGSAGSAQWVDAVRFGSLRRFGGVPARITVVLGLDQDRLSSGNSDGDDLLAADPHLGDRDRRDEERSHLLMAVMSAKESLLVLANGRSVTTNKEVSRAQILEELMDLAGRYYIGDESGAFALQVVEHPRQGFDPMNLVPEGVGANALGAGAGPWSFDPGHVRIVRATEAETSSEDFLDVILDGSASHTSEHQVAIVPISLRDLSRAVSRPIDVFARDRLEIRLPNFEDSKVSESLEIWPDAFSLTSAGRSALEAVLKGERLEDWWLRYRVVNVMPVGSLGELFFSTLSAEILELLSKADIDGLTSTSVDFEVELSPYRLVGSIATWGNNVVDIGFARYHPESRVYPLLSIAALTMVDPNVKWLARIVRRGKTESGETFSEGTLESFHLIGDSAETRLSVARSVLEYAVQCRLVALQTPVLRFRRSSWVMADGPASSVSEDLSRDLAMPAEKWVLGRSDLRTLMDRPPGPLDPDFGGGASAALGHSRALTGWWNNSVEIVDAPNAKKKRRSAGRTGRQGGDAS